MIALWMLYATAVGCLLAAAALAAEQLAVVGRLPRRWGWFAAVLALLVLPFATPARQPVAIAPAVGSAPIGQSIPAGPVINGPTITRTMFPASEPPAPAPAPTLLERISFPNVARFDGVLLIGWAAASILLLAGYFGATLALAYQRRRWHGTHIDGTPVLIAPNIGPAVVGTVRQRIVLPAWVFALEPGMRALVMAHEREHLRARDPLLLHFVTIVAYLLPWNFPLWWMLHRLRLAIELDCDRRVLGAGFEARRYANLLLTVGSRRGFAGRLVAPALGERKSLLFRRIIAISQCRPRFGRLRGAVAAGAIGALAALAWFIPVPARAQQDDPPTPLSGTSIAEDTSTSAISLPPVLAAVAPRGTAPVPQPQERPRRSHAPEISPSRSQAYTAEPSRVVTAETSRVPSTSGGRRAAPDSGSVAYQYIYQVRSDSTEPPANFRLMITKAAAGTSPVITVNGEPVHLDEIGPQTIVVPNGRSRVFIQREADGRIIVRVSADNTIIFDSDAAFRTPRWAGPIITSPRVLDGDIIPQVRLPNQLQWQQTQDVLSRLLQTRLQRESAHIQQQAAEVQQQAAKLQPWANRILALTRGLGAVQSTSDGDERDFSFPTPLTPPAPH